PLCVVVGHVDHGKSSILDKIRGTAIVQSEAGAITQAIGASIIPLETIQKVCGPLLEKMNMNFTLPGLLFIDTPGHAAFTSLRKRGGNLADIAILVVDINEGFKPQTIEAIEILKSFKTPFIVAANKVDLIAGWHTKEGTLIEDIKAQAPDVQQKLDAKLYELVAKFYEMGFQAERYDRLEDYTKQLAIIPCSAKSGEGLPELMSILTGLAQKFLEQNLQFEENTSAKGTVLEVKEEVGLGKTLDVIIYDGTIKKNDQIVLGSTDGPVITKVRALLQPAPLSEMRDKKSDFKPVEFAVAATGIKISAPDIENVVSGMPLRVVGEGENEQAIKNEIQSEVDQIMIETEKEGIVIKADTLGGLEALTNLLKEKSIMIKKADIGNISKHDLAEAESSFEKNPLNSVILGFNVELNKDVEQTPKVKIITSNIIYKAIEDFEKWKEEAKKDLEKLKLDVLARPAKFVIMQNHTFRQSNPAIVGVDILAGKLKTGVGIMKNGKNISSVKSMKDEKENLKEAEAGKQLAVAMDGVMVGRQINERDTLYSTVPEEDFRKLKELKDYLSSEEKGVLKEIAKIMREKNPVWGV
ncbi:translation initiation factor IF-2, partial [Candidatus Woesearchaeota archaeon]|nr:translation initiation factor IF-2 [Candidatus Woesearchaeota archaeon]